MMDWAGLAYFKWDKDYEPYPKRIFYDNEKAAIEYFWIEDDDAEIECGIDPQENASHCGHIINNPHRYSELTIPDHGLRHEWFREWLITIDMLDLYCGSIGGFFRENDKELTLRPAWKEFERRKLKALITAEIEAI